MSRRRCQIILEWAETLWGRKEGAAEEKGSNDPVTFDTVLQMQNGYSSRNLTKRARFDGNWYRQWPVAGSVGCLSVSREAYQMTLKISSATITLEGKRRTFHIWWAQTRARWKEQCEASWSNFLLCAPHWNCKGQKQVSWSMSESVALPKEAFTCIHSLTSFAWLYLCHW